MVRWYRTRRSHRRAGRTSRRIRRRAPMLRTCIIMAAGSPSAEVPPEPSAQGRIVTPDNSDRRAEQERRPSPTSVGASRTARPAGPAHHTWHHMRRDSAGIGVHWHRHRPRMRSGHFRDGAFWEWQPVRMERRMTSSPRRERLRRPEQPHGLDRRHGSTASSHFAAHERSAVSRTGRSPPITSAALLPAAT